MCSLLGERSCTLIRRAVGDPFRDLERRDSRGVRKKQELAQYCRHSSDMVEEAVRVFERVSLNRAWYQRLVENREVIAEQLDAMAYIMQDCAREEKILDVGERHVLSEIQYRAKEQGIVVEELHLIEAVDGRIRIDAVLKSRLGGCVAVKTFLALSGAVLEKAPDNRGCADVYCKGAVPVPDLRGHRIPERAGNCAGEEG